MVRATLLRHEENKVQCASFVRDGFGSNDTGIRTDEDVRRSIYHKHIIDRACNVFFLEKMQYHQFGRFKTKTFSGHHSKIIAVMSD